MLAVAATNQWKINALDIKAAFLQGKCIDRDIFLRPPREANCQGKLWKLRKVVYGLSDASRVWYLRVVEELASLGVEVSRYDKATFTMKSETGLEGIIIVHVDDFLWAGTQKFVQKVISPIKKVFKISKESSEAFKYVGVDLKQDDESISINQYQYIDSLKPIEIDISQPNDSQRPLTTKEKKDFQGLVGQFYWSINMSRPDMSFQGCSLGTVQSKPKLGDLKRANKYLRDMKSDKVALKFCHLDQKSLKLIVFADASYANLTDGGSQGGHIMFLCDKHGRCAPISWASKRIKRVARSTLSAETQSVLEAVDTAHLVKMFLSDILGQEISVTLYTDNKSLTDAINTTNLVQDRRLRVDLASLREMNDDGEVNFKWVESKGQVADVLTKVGASKKHLLQILKICILA